MAGSKTKIFVGRLPDGVTDSELTNLFQKYGEVTECDVINKYGFVHMATPEQADMAVKMLNNYNLLGSTISVEPSKSKLHPEPGAPGRANRDTMMNRRGGMGNGYSGPSRGGFDRPGSYRNGYGRQYDPPHSMGGGDPYFDRPYPGGGYGAPRDRMRPYPPPYERPRVSDLPPLRDEYPRRPLPPMRDDPYARAPPPPMRDELYERRPEPERRDFLYSRRSPPQPMGRPSYAGYDSPYDSGSRAPPPTATRRPAYY